MAEETSDQFFCVDAGNRDSDIICCHLSDDPNLYPCHYLASPDYLGFPRCPTGDCISDCQNLTSLYYLPGFFDSIDQLNQSGLLYNFCLNLPTVYGFFKQGLLPAAYTGSLSQYFPDTLSLEGLQNITSAVTHCLISTCDQSRGSKACTELCSPSALLINSATPSYYGVSNCLNRLCNNFNIGLGGLPYANSDIVGIGVFCSYIAQCAIVIIIWILFAIFDLIDHRKALKGVKKIPERREALITGLVDFHKQQCFFSIALQVASIASNIFQLEMLSEFTLLPIATNGILPVLFTFLLLVRYGRSSTYLLTLTVATWLVVSVVFWSLYHYLPGRSAVDWEWGIYTQFTNELSQFSSCGGYSAQAVCGYTFDFNPTFILNPVAITYSALRLTPLIWTWCSICLTCLIAYQVWHKSALWKRLQAKTSDTVHHLVTPIRRFRIFTFLERHSDKRVVAFWLTSMIFLACFAFQFYLFWTTIALEIIKFHALGFGQIVAITIWFPPVIEYFYLQLTGVINGSKYRLAKTLTVTRLSAPSPTSSRSDSAMSLQSHATHHPQASQTPIVATGQETTPADGVDHANEVAAGSPTDGQTQNREVSTADSADLTNNASEYSALAQDVPDSDLNAAEIFRIASRPTLRMEEGTSAISSGVQVGADSTQSRGVP